MYALMMADALIRRDVLRTTCALPVGLIPVNRMMNAKNRRTVNPNVNLFDLYVVDFDSSFLDIIQKKGNS